MKLLSFFLFIGVLAWSQNTDPSVYQTYLESNPQKNTIPVRIFLNKQLDSRSLNESFKDRGLSKEERAQELVQKLQEQAKEQQVVIDYLAEKSITNVQSFWIINMISAQLNLPTIHLLQNHPSVHHIELNDEKIIFIDPKTPQELEIVTPEKSPNGLEPGLEAINVRPLWEMGYTGRGKIAYTYDTGIWPTHPAISENFIGNYRPIDQAYYPYFQEEPNGNISSHGTHVTGTMMGLEKSTNDTIGVAWNAYFIANDLVTSTVEALPPIDEMVLAFQWALNPDGDLNTFDDIPDVINNSWRWYDGADTLHCGGFVVDLMNTLEAAGIAVIFSGGNSGPNNTTVNSPQRINTSEVNTFSVGSINAHDTLFPISSFSTRGPKQCPGTGSLIIHPEVVAPGQNVRSAWGTDSYNSISGTSMASPHVSGVTLLLKEAFPMASGEEILTAIYYTASDLGEVGEDNTYGMGLIDAYAAFLYLSNTYTPAPPITGTDLKIADFIADCENWYTCDPMNDIQIKTSNIGDSVASNIMMSYDFNGVQFNDNVTGSINAGSNHFSFLNDISFPEGPFEMMIEVSSDETDIDLINNQRVFRSHYLAPNEFPYLEQFQAPYFSYNNWFRNNRDVDEKWDTLSNPNQPLWSSNAITFSFSMDVSQNNTDELISAPIPLPSNADSLFLAFDYSYNHRHNAFSDTLEVLISSDCGNSWETVFYLGGSDLNTSEQNTEDYYPASFEEWSHFSTVISDYAGENIQLQFKAINRRGNRLWIDNIAVYENNPPAGIEYLEPIISLNPNPSNGFVEITSNQHLNDAHIYIYNLTGKLINEVSFNSLNNCTLNLSDVAKGSYFIHIQHQDGRRIEKLILE